MTKFGDVGRTYPNRFIYFSITTDVEDKHRYTVVALRYPLLRHFLEHTPQTWPRT